MKKFRLICLIFAAAVLLQFLNLPAYAQADASVSSGCHSIDAAIPLVGTEKMLDTAQAVLLYERNSDTLVYTYEADKTLDPSSMAKIMTALIAIERADLSQMATASKSAISSVGSGVLSIQPRMEPGEEFSIESLLYCMMAASDNDAAAVIAETVAGSQEVFVYWMNEKVKELGCLNTYFANAHGLYDETAYTTARDICRILDAALDNETFCKIFGTKEYTVPATNLNEERLVKTTNYMIDERYASRYFDKRVTGGKTGTDSKGGRCLAVTAEDNGMELLAIVMGAKPVPNEEDPTILDSLGNFEEMKVLLDYAWENLMYRQVFYEGQTFSQYPVTNGSNHAVTTPVRAASVVLPKDFTQEQIRWELGQDTISLTAPLKSGHKISYVEAWYGNICIAQTDLVAMHDVDVYVAPVEPEAPAHRDEDAGGAIIATVFGVILAIVVLVIVGMFLVNWARNANARRRRKYRRRSR